MSIYDLSTIGNMNMNMNININVITPLIKRRNAKIFPINNYILMIHSGGKGNPRITCMGAVIYNHNEEIWCSSQILAKEKTILEAEYAAIIIGLKQAISKNIKHLTIFGDNLLVINQVIGMCSVNTLSLIPLHREVEDLKLHFDSIEFNHIYRTYNKKANELCNLALSIT